MIHLSSRRLEVAVCAPGEEENNRFRFDRTGFVRQVTLDGGTIFCGVEPDTLPHPPSGGAGLCSEILCKGVDTEAPVDGWFPKFGVGLLRRPDNESYIFHRCYSCDPFEVQTENGPDSARFVTLPKPCMGYALRGEKSITVHGNVLRMEYLFENTGKRELNLTEYCHNFITLNGEKTGPAIHLEFPSARSQAGKAGRRESSTMRGAEYGFGFIGEGLDPSRITVTGGEINRSREFTWKLRSDTTGLSVAGTVSFAPSEVVVWSVGALVSPEVMHSFSLTPGERISYTRQWTFEGP